MILVTDWICAERFLKVTLTPCLRIVAVPLRHCVPCCIESMFFDIVWVIFQAKWYVCRVFKGLRCCGWELFFAVGHRRVRPSRLGQQHLPLWWGAFPPIIALILKTIIWKCHFTLLGRSRWHFEQIWCLLWFFVFFVLFVFFVFFLFLIIFLRWASKIIAIIILRDGQLCRRCRNRFLVPTGATALSLTSLFFAH